MYYSYFIFNTLLSIILWALYRIFKKYRRIEKNQVIYLSVIAILLSYNTAGRISSEVYTLCFFRVQGQVCLHEHVLRARACMYSTIHWTIILIEFLQNYRTTKWLLVTLVNLNALYFTFNYAWSLNSQKKRKTEQQKYDKLY